MKHSLNFRIHRHANCAPALSQRKCSGTAGLSWPEDICCDDARQSHRRFFLRSGIMLSENSIKELRTNLRGGLIEPGDQAYDEARKVYNGMIHKRPRLIARCADAADVIHSVNFSREHNL